MADGPATVERIEEPVVTAALVVHDAERERRGRRWVVWSFILCPCHLPVTLGVLGTVFGGTAFGPLIARNGWTVAIVLTAIYAVALGIGLRHVHLANKGIDCSSGECELPALPQDPGT